MWLPLALTQTHTPHNNRQECKRSGVNFISPEHILLAMLNAQESNGRQVLVRYALTRQHHACTIPHWPPIYAGKVH